MNNPLGALVSYISGVDPAAERKRQCDELGVEHRKNVRTHDEYRKKLNKDPLAALLGQIMNRRSKR